MKNIPLIATALLCVGLFGCSGSGAPEITDGWVRLAPPNAKVNAGYVSIDNPSDSTLELVAGSAEGYERLELHMMRMNGGNMIMRQVDSFSIPAGGSLTLSPGSDHLMLIAPSETRKEGDVVKVVLQLKAADGSVTELPYPFPVRRN
jgi:copper(I)-binding protein